jgi:deferrochelatase/peroxidase EfeB
VLNLAPAPAEAGTRPQSPTFTDVSPSDWFYQAVETAVQAGIAKGYGDGTFRPGAPISRQEIACVLVQALGKSQLANANAQAATKFLDDQSIAWWSRGFIFIALQQGLVSGYPDNTYQPRSETSRAEACAMIANFLKIYSK